MCEAKKCMGFQVFVLLLLGIFLPWRYDRFGPRQQIFLTCKIASGRTKTQWHVHGYNRSVDDFGVRTSLVADGQDIASMHSSFAAAKFWRKLVVQITTSSSKSCVSSSSKCTTFSWPE